jgi:hypothetical protein
MTVDISSPVFGASIWFAIWHFQGGSAKIFYYRKPLKLLENGDEKEAQQSASAEGRYRGLHFRSYASCS